MKTKPAAKSLPTASRRRFMTASASALAVAGVGAIAYTLRGFLRGGHDAQYEANTRLFIDSVTRKSFNITLTPDMQLPIQNPDTGNPSYPAELCFWTREGTTKDDPTAVLLLDYLHPGTHEPTFCPDCDRLVVEHNPRPRTGMRPPPTRQEYLEMHSG